MLISNKIFDTILRKWFLDWADRSEDKACDIPDTPCQNRNWNILFVIFY